MTDFLPTENVYNFCSDFANCNSLALFRVFSSSQMEMQPILKPNSELAETTCFPSRPIFLKPNSQRVSGDDMLSIEAHFFLKPSSDLAETTCFPSRPTFF